MSIAIFDAPIPVVVVEDGIEKDGYAIYVESGKTFENDCWRIALADGGFVRHYTSKDIRIWNNATYGVKKINNETEKS